MAVSPFSLLNDARPLALAGRAIGAARELAGDARAALRDKSFGDVVQGLDANRDGQLSGSDLVGRAGQGAAKVFSALSGIEIDKAGTTDTLRRTGDLTTILQDTNLASQTPPAPVPPTVAGIHQLYDTLRAMR